MVQQISIEASPAHVGEQIRVRGWVVGRRDHGKIVFLDIEDESREILQVVLSGELYERGRAMFNIEERHPAVVSVEGEVVRRPDKMKNPKLATGEVELKAAKEPVAINLSEPLPVPVDGDGYDVREDVRLAYRYLDLRRPRLRENLIVRHRVIQYMRNFLSEQGFIEVETPILSKSTPEGARDFLVPSRLHSGRFYALPQSPQQYKQLLMVARLGKYFQIARCFRDEDTRGDRQPEFTQLDIEMAFATQDGVLSLMGELYRTLVKELFPKKRITKEPFPRLTHEAAMKEHGVDRPDLRENKEDGDELAFCFVTEFPMFEAKDDGSLGAAHHPFTLPTLDTADDPEVYQHEGEKRAKLMEVLKSGDKEKLLKLRAYQYDVVCNGYEIGGGSIRTYDPKMLSLVFEALGNEAGDVQAQFGHLLEAFGYGVPPHGGIAMGLDRFITILQKEPNIREVIAFPKTGDGRDLMMRAPSEANMAQLKELGLKIAKKE